MPSPARSPACEAGVPDSTSPRIAPSSATAGDSSGLDRSLRQIDRRDGRWPGRWPRSCAAGTFGGRRGAPAEHPGRHDRRALGFGAVRRPRGHPGPGSRSQSPCRVRDEPARYPSRPMKGKVQTAESMPGEEMAGPASDPDAGESAESPDRYGSGRASRPEG